VLQNGLSSDGTGYSNGAFGTGNIVVSGSGTLSARNNSTVANNISISGSGWGGDQGAIRGSFGSSNQTATLTGTVTLTSAATIKSAALNSSVGSKFVLAGPINLGANVLTLSSRIANNSSSSSNNVPIEVRGNIAGTGSVVIAAEPLASVLLSGSSSYSGGTQVDAGTLRVGNSYAVGTGALQVNNGGILDVNGQSLHASSLDLRGGSTTLMDISGTAAGTYAQVVQATTVAFGGALIINFSQSGFVVDDFWQLFGEAGYRGHFSSVTATGAYGPLRFDDLGNGEWKALLSGGRSLSFYENNDHAFNGLFTAGQLVVVPEPSAVMIAGIGVVLAGYRGWRRRRVA
jgi:autotransporter-associated beta strand protein